jgi:hypothetical protein
MTEQLPRRVQHWEAEEKLGYENGIKFMNLQAHIRVLFKAGTLIPKDEEDRFWNTYYHFFHNQ